MRLPVSSKKMTLKDYQKTDMDKKEDERNAKKAGMSVTAWKHTTRAINIDKKDLKKLNRVRTT